MSFKTSNNGDNPVFDKPPQNTAKGFFIRRLMSLAGKPLLAEKNLPIQPSSNESAEKCYVNKAALLYRQQRPSTGSRDFKPVVCKYAVPQHNSFTNSGRGINKFNQISAHNPVLKTVFANKPADSLAQIAINKYNTAVAEHFENRAETVDAYAFARHDTSPHLLGNLAILNSIKFAGSCINTGKSALFSGFIKRLNWQPRDFTYSDSQIIFSSEFPDVKDRFVAYLPGKCHFAMFPGNYDFLPTRQSSICNLTQNSCKQSFTTNARSSVESFDYRTEFARNLVIVCSSYFCPVEGLDTTCRSTAPNFTPSCAVNSRPLCVLPKHGQLSPSTLTILKSGFAAASRINSPIDRNLQAAPGKQDTHKASTDPFTGSPLLNLACNASRSRMKLRLRIKYACYKEPGSEMRTLVYQPDLLSKMPLPVKLTASYKPLVLAERSRSLAQIPFSDIRPTYAVRRSSMRFASTRHAHYCRKAIKRIVDRDYLPGNAVQICNDYCSSHILPATLRYRDSFISTKLHHAAISVIYLRSMPFLMKLSAMDFTDIFLPEAQRRAVPSGAVFFSDFSPLPSRRRNTLKSLRFKLSRINDGFTFDTLRAQRRILPSSAIFSLYTKTRQISISESDRVSTLPAEKAYLPGYRGRLERFALPGCLPSQILAQMKLKMPILGQETGISLAQKHFIYPASWETVTKPHKCRTILAPHPFGFPNFLLPVDSFHLVESAISFKFILPSPSRLNIADDCRFFREKVFLPPLSLKNPRRFLFPGNSFARATRNLYHTIVDILHGTIKTPAQIQSFDHDWGLKRSRKLPLKALHRLSTVRARQKSTDHFVIDPATFRYPLMQPPAPLFRFFAPRIHRLLLSFDKLFSTASKVVELTTGRSATTCNPEKFAPILRIPIAESFRKSGGAFIFKRPGKIKFDEKFSRSNKCMSNDFNFRHRPRIFRFPYRPEYSRAEFNVDFGTQEEPLLDRLTFLDQINLGGCYLSFVELTNPSIHTVHGQLNKSSYLQPKSFVSKIAEVCCPRFCENVDRAETRLDYEKSRYPQQIDESSFKKLIDVAKLKLKKFKHISSQITGYLATNLLPSTEDFSIRTGSRIPRRLSYDNLHWIILLRSFIELTMHSENLFSSRISTGSDPEFSSLKASFANDYCRKHSAERSSPLHPVRTINNYALSTIPETRIALAVKPPPLCSGILSPATFTPTSLPAVSYDCLVIPCDFNMSLSERPEYRRNIELYILHMAIAIDDYELFLSVSGRPFADQTSQASLPIGEYRHPHLPEWIDLPQPLAHRTKMCI